MRALLQCTIVLHCHQDINENTILIIAHCVTSQHQTTHRYSVSYSMKDEGTVRRPSKISKIQFDSIEILTLKHVEPWIVFMKTVLVWTQCTTRTVRPSTSQVATSYLAGRFSSVLPQCLTNTRVELLGLQHNLPGMQAAGTHLQPQKKTLPATQLASQSQQDGSKTSLHMCCRKQSRARQTSLRPSFLVGKRQIRVEIFQA